MMIVNITLLSSSSHWLTSATIPFDSSSCILRLHDSGSALRLFENINLLCVAFLLMPLLFIFFYSRYFFATTPFIQLLLFSASLVQAERQLSFGWMTSERNKCDNIKLDFRLSSVVFQLILLQSSFSLLSL